MIKEENMQEVAEHNLSPTSLFQGYNAVLGIGMSTAVKGAPPTNIGAESFVNCTICKTMKEVSDAMEVDASFSASYAGVSVDAKANYLHSTKITTNSLSIVVRAKQIANAESMTSATLLDEIKLETISDVKNFVAAYGDSFISKVVHGGEYIATYVFYCESDEEQTEIETSLGIKSGGVSLELSMKLKHVQSTTTVRSELFQYLSGVTGVEKPKGEDIADFALKFSKLHLNAPVICGFEWKGYEDLPKLASIFEEVAERRRYFCGGEVFSGLNNKLSTLLEVKNEIDEIQSIYKFYGGHTDQQLTARLAENESDITAIKKQHNMYRHDPAQAFEEPPLRSLANGAPRLMFKPFKDFISGSDNGDAFDDIPNIRAHLRKKTRIASIAIEDTFFIKRLSTIYRHSAGFVTETKSHDSAGFVTETKSHGVGGGHYKPPLMMDEGVVISEMSGAEENNGGDPSIHMISFKDSDGVSMTGGEPATVPFNWPLPKERFVLGFFGRTNGDGIRALGVHTAEFANAKWS
jgi:hypothetical protein